MQPPDKSLDIPEPLSIHRSNQKQQISISENITCCDTKKPAPSPHTGKYRDLSTGENSLPQSSTVTAEPLACPRPVQPKGIREMSYINALINL